MTREFLDARSRELYEDGYRRIASGFEPEWNMVLVTGPPGQFYYARDSLAYALCLVRDGGQEDVAVAERIIETILSMQELRPGNTPGREENRRWPPFRITTGSRCSDGKQSYSSSEKGKPAERRGRKATGLHLDRFGIGQPGYRA